jgi:hypothetical protein
MDNDLLIAYYSKIGAIEVSGIDEDGQFLYTILEKAKEVAPELWKVHIEHIDDMVLDLYKRDLAEIEYDENLEAIVHFTEEGLEEAKKIGIIPMNIDRPL